MSQAWQTIACPSQSKAVPEALNGRKKDELASTGRGNGHDLGAWDGVVDTELGRP